MVNTYITQLPTIIPDDTVLDSTVVQTIGMPDSDHLDEQYILTGNKLALNETDLPKFLISKQLGHTTVEYMLIGDQYGTLVDQSYFIPISILTVDRRFKEKLLCTQGLSSLLNQKINYIHKDIFELLMNLSINESFDFPELYPSLSRLHRKLVVDYETFCSDTEQNLCLDLNSILCSLTDSIHSCNHLNMTTDDVYKNVEYIFRPKICNSLKYDPLFQIIQRNCVINLDDILSSCKHENVEVNNGHDVDMSALQHRLNEADTVDYTPTYINRAYEHLKNGIFKDLHARFYMVGNKNTDVYSFVPALVHSNAKQYRLEILNILRSLILQLFDHYKKINTIDHKTVLKCGEILFINDVCMVVLETSEGKLVKIEDLPYSSILSTNVVNVNFDRV